MEIARAAGECHVHDDIVLLSADKVRDARNSIWCFDSFNPLGQRIRGSMLELQVHWYTDTSDKDVCEIERRVCKDRGGKENRRGDEYEDGFYVGSQEGGGGCDVEGFEQSVLGVLLGAGECFGGVEGMANCRKERGR